MDHIFENVIVNIDNSAENDEHIENEDVNLVTALIFDLRRSKIKEVEKNIFHVVKEEAVDRIIAFEAKAAEQTCLGIH